MIASRRRKIKGEPTIALINIVFLILIFFMVAGTLAPSPDPSIEFVGSEGLECCAPPDALSISASGILSRNGEAYASEKAYLSAYPSQGEVLRILPDHRLPAAHLLKTLSALKVAGADQITLLAENGS